MKNYIAAIGFIAVFCAVSSPSVAHEPYALTDRVPVVTSAIDVPDQMSAEFNAETQRSFRLKESTRKKRVRVVQPLPHFTQNLSLEVMTLPGDGEVVDELKFYSHVFEYERRGDWVRISPNGKTEKWVKLSGLYASQN